MLLGKKIIYSAIRFATCLLIVKKYRKIVRKKLIEKCAKQISESEASHIRKRYAEVIKRIRAKNGKIRVAFLISENQKWVHQSLYDELLKNEHFEPIVLITRLTPIHKGKDKHRSDIEENVQFFKSKGIETQIAYNLEKRKYIPLEHFNIDLVFYQQVWFLARIQKAYVSSKYMLSAYIPYCFHMLEVDNNYLPHFHKIIWKYFVESDLYEQAYLKEYNAKNCVALGHTKMDNFILNKKVTPKKTTIIYAPHHYNTIKYSFVTFDWSGKEILNFAKDHPEYEWIFKPHPFFKISCINHKIMSEEEINEYFDEWAKIGTVYTQGDYFPLFNRSSCLITDCISFLAEYMPTENPVFFLKSGKQKADFTPLGKQITRNYYHINDWPEFSETFDRVIKKSDDYLRQKRLDDLQCLMIDKEKTAAKKITEYLESELVNK